MYDIDVPVLLCRICITSMLVLRSRGTAVLVNITRFVADILVHACFSCARFSVALVLDTVVAVVISIQHNVTSAGSSFSTTSSTPQKKPLLAIKRTYNNVHPSPARNSSKATYFWLGRALPQDSSLIPGLGRFRACGLRIADYYFVCFVR